MAIEAIETCMWYDSIQRPECGKPAVVKVKVSGRVNTVTVPLCAEHKSIHDERFARIRNARKAAS